MMIDNFESMICIKYIPITTSDRNQNDDLPQRLHNANICSRNEITLRPLDLKSWIADVQVINSAVLRYGLRQKCCNGVDKLRLSQANLAPLVRRRNGKRGIGFRYPLLGVRYLNLDRRMGVI